MNFSSLFFSIAMHAVPAALAPRLLDFFFLFGIPGLAQLFLCMLRLSEDVVAAVANPDDLIYVIRKEVVVKMLTNEADLHRLLREFNRRATIEDVVCFK